MGGLSPQSPKEGPKDTPEQIDPGNRADEVTWISGWHGNTEHVINPVGGDRTIEARSKHLHLKRVQRTHAERGIYLLRLSLALASALKLGSRAPSIVIT
jgi:hypothetical protein